MDNDYSTLYWPDGTQVSWVSFMTENPKEAVEQCGGCKAMFSRFGYVKPKSRDSCKRCEDWKNLH